MNVLGSRWPVMGGVRGARSEERESNLLELKLEAGARSQEPGARGRSHRMVGNGGVQREPASSRFPLHPSLSSRLSSQQTVNVRRAVVSGDRACSGKVQFRAEEKVLLLTLMNFPVVETATQHHMVSPSTSHLRKIPGLSVLDAGRTPHRLRSNPHH